MKIRSLLLGLYFMSLPFETWNLRIGNSSFTICMLISIIYFVSMLPLLVKIPLALYNKYKRFIIPLIIFFIYLTLVNSLNINYKNSYFFNSTIFLCTFMLIVMLIHGYYDPRAIHTAIIYYILGTIFMSILFIFGAGVEYDSDRLIIFGNNPNSAGVKIALGIVFLLTEIILYDYLNLKSLRFFFFLLAPIMFMLVIATASRIAIISLFIAFMLIIVLYKTRIKFKILLIAFGILMSSFSIKYLLSNDVLFNRLTSTINDGDTSGRGDIWVMLLPDIKENFVFGVGQTGYTLISMSRLNRLYDNDIQGYSPHNVIIEIILITGLIGIISYLLFWYRVFISATYSYRKYKYLTGLLILIFILGTIMSSQILESKSFYALYACIIISAAPSYYKK